MFITLKTFQKNKTPVNDRLMVELIALIMHMLMASSPILKNKP